MKKLLLLMISLSWLTFAYAQEMITGGNLESDASWTVFWRSDAADMGTTAFNYTSDIPSNGAGGCLSIESFGQTGAHVYQMVTLIPGHSYSFTGAFKNANSSDDTLHYNSRGQNLFFQEASPRQEVISLQVQEILFMR